MNQEPARTKFIGRVYQLVVKIRQEATELFRDQHTQSQTCTLTRLLQIDQKFSPSVTKIYINYSVSYECLFYKALNCLETSLRSRKQILSNLMLINSSNVYQK